MPTTWAGDNLIVFRHFPKLGAMFENLAKWDWHKLLREQGEKQKADQIWAAMPWQACFNTLSPKFIVLCSLLAEMVTQRLWQACENS